MNVKKGFKKYGNKTVPLWAVLVLLAIILLSAGFTGNHYSKAFKEEMQNQIDQNKAEIKQSKKREDSLIKSSEDQKFLADQLRIDNEKLQLQNNNLYYELQKRNKQIFVMDPDFMSNAKRLAEGSHRFYQQNDSIR